jgi:hypothetical protein
VTSARRRDANRRNARLSTGPRTSAGKARAAQNARRHGLSLPARYNPSWCEEIEALARAIAGASADVDAERLELARRIAEAQIDVIRARSARRDLFPATLREPAATTRLTAIDRYERSALSRRKRAIRALDDACSVERAGDPAGHLAERSQLRAAEQTACVAPALHAAGGPEPERHASPDCPSADLAERGQRELAERSQRETFRVGIATEHFGRTKPMAAVTMAFSATLSGCHRPRKWTIQYPPKSVRGRRFQRHRSCTEHWTPHLRGDDQRELRRISAHDPVPVTAEAP